MSLALKNIADISLQQFAIHPKKSIWVNASAGSGKTKTLTDRVLSLLLSGAEPSSILCLTFTKAAAAEMLDRVMKKLKSWSVMQDKSQLTEELSYYAENITDKTYKIAKTIFYDLLDAGQNNLSIETIHSFCQKLLKNFPFEAGISPVFTILSEQEAKDVLQQTLSNLLQPEIYTDSKLSNKMEYFSRYLHDQQFYDFLQRLVSEYPKLSKSLKSFATEKELEKILAQKLAINSDLTLEKLQEKFFTILSNQQDNYLQFAEDLTSSESAMDLKKADFLVGYFSEFNDIGDNPPDLWKLIEFYLTGKRDKSARQIRKSFVTSKWLKTFPEYKIWLEEQADFIVDWLEEYNSLIIYQSSIAIYSFTGYFVKQYEAAKQLKTALDYDDLIEKSLALLEDPNISSWILYKFDQKIDHILVDEAQDTNPEQWKIIQKLCEDFLSGTSNDKTKTLFIVGDAKQSIFGFQGANIDIYYEVQDYFAHYAKQARLEWHEVDLPINYRSHPDILQFTDDFIAKITPQKLGLQQDKIEHIAHRKNTQGGVTIWPIFEPNDKDTPIAWKPPVEKEYTETSRSRLANAVADEIEKILQAKIYLPSQERIVEPRDIMILMRRRSGFIDELTRNLKRKNIPIMGSDRLILNKQLLIMDLMALAKFILLPEDDLNLAILLKSPLCNLSEDVLLYLCVDRGDNGLWQRLQSEVKFQDTADFLEDLKSQRPQNLFAFFYELLARPVRNYASAKEAFLTRLGSNQIDVLQEFLNLIYQYEQNNISSLQYFVNWFESQTHILKREMDAKQNQVRILTVHGSKGLQAPIVFMPDTTQKPRAFETLLWDDNDQLLWVPKTAFHNSYTKLLLEDWKNKQNQEYYRLLYVALTRAEDYLYIAGWQTHKSVTDDAWYNLLA